MRPSKSPMVQNRYAFTSYCFERSSIPDTRPLNSDEMAMPAMTMNSSDVPPRMPAMP